MINVVCEVFVITGTHDADTLLLKTLFQMSTSRNKKNIYTLFFDEFMTKKTLDSIGIQSTRIFDDQFHLKVNLKTSLICRENVLLPIINSMFFANNEKY